MAGMHFIVALIGSVAAYLLPGYFLARLLGAKAPWLAGFFISILLLFHAVFWVGLAGVSITAMSVGTVLLAVGLIAGWLVRQKNQGELFAVPPASAWFEFGRAFSGRIERTIGLFLLLGLAVVAVRTCRLPLLGYDTYWRWDFIAQLIYERRALDFYPAVTAEQMRIYPWFDGFPPLVSITYWWSYALHGGPMRQLTTVSVLLQLLVAGALAYRLGRSLGGGGRAGVWALGAFAATPVAVLALTIGQETGFTTLALLGAACFLAEADGKDDRKAAVLAAVCTSVGALSREYGPAFVVMGAAMMLMKRMSLRSIVLFTAVAAAIVLPWYVRNWIVYRNPFGGFDFLGLFPANERLAAIMRHFNQTQSAWKYPPSKMLDLLWLLICSGCVPALLGMVAMLARPRQWLWLALPTFGCVALFIHSLAVTMSYHDYAARVMAPGLVLAAAVMGAVAARWMSTTERRTVKPIVVLAVVGALGWSLFNSASIPMLGANLTVKEWWAKVTAEPDDLRGVKDYVNWLNGRFPPGSRLIMEQSMIFRALHDSPVRAVACTSREADFLWDDRLTRAQVHEAARERGIVGVMIDGGPMGLYIFSRSRFLREDPEFAAFLEQRGKSGRILIVPLGEPGR